MVYNIRKSLITSVNVVFIKYGKQNFDPKRLMVCSSCISLF